jgi:hypothetical protein
MKCRRRSAENLSCRRSRGGSAPGARRPLRALRWRLLPGRAMTDNTTIARASAFFMVPPKLRETAFCVYNGAPKKAEKTVIGVSHPASQAILGIRAAPPDDGRRYSTETEAPAAIERKHACRTGRHARSSPAAFSYRRHAKLHSARDVRRSTEAAGGCDFSFPYDPSTRKSDGRHT